METNVWKFIWKYLKQVKYIFLILLITFSIDEAVQPLSAYVVSKIVGIISEENAKDIVFATVLGKNLLLLAIVIWIGDISDVIRRYIEEVKFKPYFQTKVSVDLFNHVHMHSIRFFNEEMAGNITGKVNNIIDSLVEIYRDVTFGIIHPVITIILSVFFIALESPSLAAIIFIFEMLIATLMIITRKRITPYSALYAKISSETQGSFVDGVTNANLIKSFGNFLFERLNFYKLLKKSTNALRAESRISALLDSLTSFMFDTIGFVWWYYFDLSTAGVVLVITLSRGMSYSAGNLAFMASFITKAYGKIKDGLEMLAKPCEIEDCKGAKPLKIKTADINFKDIDYQYAGKNKLFDKFNLNIAAGEKIGLVGHSGAGKSTLIKLLLRFYDVNNGKIEIDKQNIAKITQDSLHKNISYVPQEASLFNRSIMENIRYGRTDATDEEVIAAAKKAFCHDFIVELPNGYDSKVGERGVMLSGGERQRISIARAILRNSPILILDEATSALDSLSERYIQQSLKELMKGKTVIAIAHRLSTLKEMNKLIVLENGKIIENGSHSELLAAKGAYYGFYNLQSEGFINTK